ncbi:SDR family oxidoreductase [Rhodococcus sp. NBC_00297]|uniref:SDR family oxidoreductase n=1 Tax=Rhodococcus sp. NBC_00297 TaxID=2976005 RepID=UPI002E28636B|nr:SDR family oxidoreductase [Rhodococcus sp. NBC_00297]
MFDVGRDPSPLRGRTVVVTGVSRRAGIGHAVACRAAAYGANVLCHHFSQHDEQQPWGADDIGAVMDSVRGHLTDGARVVDLEADLADPGAPEQLIATAHSAFGGIDALVCNQALSGFDGALGELTADDLDRHRAVNTRTSILLAQALLAQHRAGQLASVVFMTSGQNLGPMPGEVAYAAAKAGLVGVTATLADQVGGRGIRINAVNPGPVDTGYLTESAVSELEHRFAGGRVGSPDDAARLVTWLCTDEAAWITGQVINSEGGFRR